MSRVLIITDVDRDYLADQLAHGFVSAGHEMIDWPRKPSLHWSSAPVMDCDFNLPDHVWNGAGVAQGLRDRAFDLIVVPTLRGQVRGQLLAWNRAGLLDSNRDRIVAVDGEDHAMNTLPLFEQVLGAKPAVYFKRELPIGETWAKSLTFGYPAERVVPVGTERKGVAYTAHLWDWCGMDSMRWLLREGLENLNKHYPDQRWIYPNRLSVKVDHAVHQAALMAVSPSGRGYFSNRTWQCIADGCCPVIEYPWRTWSNPPTDHTECRFFRSATDCLDIVEELLDQPGQAQQIAMAAQAWLLKYHTTQAQAETIWGAIHG